MVLDQVNRTVAEHGGGNFLQKTFVSILKNRLGSDQVHPKPRSVWHSPIRKKYGN
jgi:hypothetical protein